MNNTHGDILHNTIDAPYRVKPEETTGELSSNKSHGGYQLPRGEMGWICPICGRGLAPSTSYCPCNLTRNITYLNGGVTIKDVLDNVIDCNPIPPEAYYTTTATTATNKSKDGTYGAHHDMHN